MIPADLAHQDINIVFDYRQSFIQLIEMLTNEICRGRNPPGKGPIRQGLEGRCRFQRLPTIRTVQKENIHFHPAMGTAGRLLTRISDA